MLPVPVVYPSHMTNYTEATVLAHHGIAPLDVSSDERADMARAYGLIGACLGCGNTNSIDPVPFNNEVEREAARKEAKAVLLEIDPDLFTCCPDATTVLY